MTLTAIPPAEVAGVLNRAAEHIDAVGWIQGRRYDDGQADNGIGLKKCRVCAYGAINVIVYGRPSGHRNVTEQQVALALAAQQVVTRHVQKDGDWQDIAAWNDDPDTTSTIVKTALRDAATHLVGGA